MKNLICLLLAIPLLFISCSKENTECEESVQVNFYAKVPQGVGTRASSGLTADKLYCAVYEDGNEHINLRTEIDIKDGEEIIFSPRLIKNRIYQVVFWACKDGAYNVGSLKNITRAASDQNNLTEEDYDAFSYSTGEFKVSENTMKSVTLTRPFAQLNMGVTEEDWSAVVEKFKLTPTRIELTIDDASNAYNALIQNPVEKQSSNISESYSLECSGNEFTCTIDNTQESFKRLAMCYVLKGYSDKPNIKYTVYGTDTNNQEVVIASDIEIQYVTLHNNYRTYIVGNLITGTAGYKISINDVFNTSQDYNKEIN